MEIKVAIPSRGKTVTLEVENNHAAGSVLEVLCDKLGLADSARWSLVHRGRTINNSQTLEELRVGDGDRFEMVETHAGKAEALTSQLKQEGDQLVARGGRGGTLVRRG
jgi:hypothetical protein